MGFQNKIQKKIANSQRKYFDIYLQHIGDEEEFISISMEEDRWNNTEYTLKAQGKRYGYIDFPGNEVPLTDLTGTNEPETKAFHLYDVLPTEGYFRFQDNIKRKDIIIKPYEIVQGEIYKVLMLQFTDVVARSTSAGVVWQKWNLAPPTFGEDLYPEIMAIVNEVEENAKLNWFGEENA